MKCKLLKKIRKRYKIIYKDGYHAVIDFKTQSVYNPVGWEAVRSTKSMYDLIILKLIDLTLGESRHEDLRYKREKRRRLKRERKLFLAAVAAPKEEKEESASTEKELYWQLSDGCDVSNVIMDLQGCMQWIENDEDKAEREYLLTPIWLTENEYKNLPEADL